MEKNAMVKPSASKVAMLFAACAAVFAGIKGTKPRMKGINDDGSWRFRRGTHRGHGMFGRVRGNGGTAEYNQGTFR